MFLIFIFSFDQAVTGQMLYILLYPEMIKSREVTVQKDQKKTKLLG